MTTILDIQRALNERGFNPGPPDGIRGRQTINALKRYQNAMHLAVDGIAGPNTLRSLFGGAVVKAEDSPDATPWLDLAYRKKGMHETLNNAALREFLKSDGGTVGDPAKLPWCGDFVETCIGLTLPDEVLPQNPYGAVNWTKFGKATTPKKGAVLVFWRGSPASWQGHVGFYVGEEAGFFHVLGGNQSNAVTITKIAKTRLREDGCRWPLTALDINTGALLADGSNLIETKNEE